MSLHEAHTTHILGSNGFIGSNLVQFLSCKGFRVIEHRSLESFELWVQKTSLEESAKATVVWAVGKVSPFIAENFPDLVREELLTFQRYLAINGAELMPLVFLSSGGCTYSSDSNLNATEETLSLGVNEYGRTKLALEKMLLQSGFRGTILRLGNVYGKSALPRKGQGVIAHWLASLKNSQPITMYGSGESQRDYIYIEDICNAIYKCFDIPHTGEVFNIGTGIGTTLIQLLNLMENFLQIEAKILWESGRPEDNFSYYLNASKFSSIAGWKANTPLQAGLAKMLF